MAKVQRWELVGLGAIVVLAATIRFWAIDQIGLSHFDSGVYAQSALWPWTGTLHFQQGYFSPPLYAGLWGVGNSIAGEPWDWGGVWLSSAAGVGLVVAGWWAGRDWFGPAAGQIAAGLLALSGLQTVFSRVALTDSLFTFLFFCSLVLTRRAVIEGGRRWLILAGLSVGAALNTKYNGFLPLVFAFPWVVSDIKVRLPRLIAITLLVAILYAPWAWSFHVEHHYQTLLQHQGGYWLGWKGVPQGLLQAMNGMDAVGGMGLGAVLFAVSIATFARGRLSAAIVLGVLALAATQFAIMTWPAILWLPLAFLGLIKAARIEDRRGLLFYLLVLLLLPAMYTPYLRLWLPTDAFLCVLAAGGVGWVANQTSAVDIPGDHRRRVVLALFYGLAALNLLSMVPAWSSHRQRFWLDVAYLPAPGYRYIAREIKVLADQGEATTWPIAWRVYTLCRWPMNYYLSLSGVDVLPLSGEPFDFSSMRRGDLLLVDRTVEDTPAFRESLSQAWRVLSPLPPRFLDVDVVTLLDDSGPNPLRGSLDDERQKQRLLIFQKP